MDDLLHRRPEAAARHRPHHRLPHAEAPAGGRASPRSSCCDGRVPLRARVQPRAPRPLHLQVAAARSSSSRAPRSSASRTRSRPGIGFVIEGHRHQIFGHCRACVARRPRSRAASRRRPREARADRGPPPRASPSCIRSRPRSAAPREKEFLLVSVSADGVTGHGECVADADPYYLPETHRHRAARPARLPGARWPSPPTSTIRARSSPRSPACVATRWRRPAWRWRCGSCARAARASRCTASWAAAGATIAAGVSIGLQKDAAALLETVAREVAAGYRRIKIKIKPGQDRALVEAVRARFPDVPLMVDANSAYTLADVPLFRELDAHAPDDGRAAAGLGRHRGPRGAAAADPHRRSASTSRSAPPRTRASALDLGACRIVNVKAGRVGGFAASLAVHDLCRARGGPRLVRRACWSRASAGWPTSTCRRCPASRCPGDTSASARYFDEDLVDPPVTVSPRTARSRCPRARASATRSCGRGCRRRRDREEWRSRQTGWTRAKGRR